MTQDSTKAQMIKAFRIADDALSKAIDDVHKATAVWTAGVLAAEQGRDEARDALMAYLFNERASEHGAIHAGFLRFVGYGRYDSQKAFFADDSDVYGAEFTPTLSALKCVWLQSETATGERLQKLLWTWEAK